MTNTDPDFKNARDVACRLTKKLFLLFVLLIACVLIACNTPVNPDPALLALQTVTAEYEAFQATEAAAIPPEPTATPIPEKKAMTFVTGGVNEALLDRLRAAFAHADFPASVTETADLGGSLDGSVSFVFFPVEPANLSEVAGANPGVSFLVLGKTAAKAHNILSIRYDPAFETFLAGFAVGLTARDWRGGAFLPADDPLLGEKSAEIFRNGMRYFCGPCKAIVAPYTVYPLTVTLPAASAPGEWVARFGEFSAGSINTLYLDPAAASVEVLTAASDQGYTLLTNGAKPEGWDGNWMGGLMIDLEAGIAEGIHSVLDGTPKNVIVPPLEVFSGNNGGTFFEGKKNLMLNLYAAMADGMILMSDPVPQSVYEK